MTRHTSCSSGFPGYCRSSSCPDECASVPTVPPAIPACTALLFAPRVQGNVELLHVFQEPLSNDRTQGLFLFIKEIPDTRIVFGPLFEQPSRIVGYCSVRERNLECLAEDILVAVLSGRAPLMRSKPSVNLPGLDLIGDTVAKASRMRIILLLKLRTSLRSWLSYQVTASWAMTLNRIPFSFIFFGSFTPRSASAFRRE